jgi:hypothetical protein
MIPYLLAIDPGKQGAIAWRYDGSPPGVIKIATNPSDIFLQILDLPDFVFASNSICFLEEVGGFVGKPQPGSAMFRFGRQVGVVEGVLAALKIEVHKIRPQKWQKALSAMSRPGEDKNAHKRRLRTIALELYPFLAKQITLQTCDALLILHVAKEHL